MKKAFTLIELIFVIVILGVLGGIGFSSMRSDYANKDGNFLLLKVKEARYKAIGFEGNKNEACIVIDRATINSNELNSPSPYNIRSNITINPNLTNNRLCFDALGRPHNGNAYNGNNIVLNNLIQQNLAINLTNSGDLCSIRVHPLSGYAIIMCR